MKTVLNLGTFHTNAYLIEITGGWLLVDTGYPFDYDHFRKAAERKKVNLSSIRYVVLTHVHADHAGFLKRILADTGAPLLDEFRHFRRELVRVTGVKLGGLVRGGT